LVKIISSGLVSKYLCCKLLEFGGEKDHIHIMFSTPPQV